MNLLYVCADPGIPLGGSKGASAHVRAVTAALAGRGHRVAVACRRLDGPNLGPAGVTVEALAEQPAEQGAWLGALIRRWRADAVLERYSLASGPAAAAAADARVPHLLEVNAPLVDEAARFRGLGDAERWRAWERAQLGAADAVVAVSEAVAAHVRAAGARRVEVVPNGVDAGAFSGADGAEVRARYGLGDGPVVGFCGSLKPWHGILTLVDALALLPPLTRALVVGDGPQRSAMLGRAETLGVASRLLVTGVVAHEAVPAHLAAIDVAVAPYSADEDFYFSPLKVLEYMAAGLPVVASAQGELRSLGGAVELVGPDDPVALAAAVTGLLDAPDRRRALGLRARALAASRSWEGVARRLEALLGGAIRSAA